MPDPLTGSRNRRSSSLRGRVVKGDGLGRKLGFPTANIALAPSSLPPFGVYIVKLRSPLRGRFALASVGLRPTLRKKTAPRLEIHIPDFSGDLYGRVLVFEILLKLREEKKFRSLQALQAAIKRDLRRFRSMPRNRAFYWKSKGD